MVLVNVYKEYLNAVTRNAILTPDKELNSLIYKSPFYIIMCRIYNLFNTVRFFGIPCRLALAFLIFRVTFMPNAADSVDGNK